MGRAGRVSVVCLKLFYILRTWTVCFVPLKGAVVNCLVCLPSSPELNVCAVYMQACAK